LEFLNISYRIYTYIKPLKTGETERKKGRREIGGVVLTITVFKGIMKANFSSGFEGSRAAPPRPSVRGSFEAG
jgi:hypothetical protein